MIVLNKKRIGIILTSIFIGVFAFSFKIAQTPENDITLETTSTPVSGKTIVIDAGHGKPDEGAFLLTLIDNN